jgi:hypothetical protein
MAFNPLSGDNTILKQISIYYIWWKHYSKGALMSADELWAPDRNAGFY